MAKSILWCGALLLPLIGGSPAYADKLDDIVAAGTLRCAVTLDIPPNGFRNEKNEAAGFDVDYCNDLGKALGVKVEIVEAQLPDRIPAILSNRADIAVAATSDTLARAKTIGLSIPYFEFKTVILTRKDTNIKSYDDIKGRKVGGVAGTYEALAMQDDLKKLADPNGSFRAYQSQADAILAVSQGQIDATPLISTTAGELMKSGKYSNLAIGGDTPYVKDYVTIICARQEYGLLNYINLFIHQQVRTGRYAELYRKWVGDGLPLDLTVPGVYR